MNKEWISVHSENPIIKEDWRHSTDVELKMPDGKELIGYYHIGGPDIPMGFRQVLDGEVIDKIILPTHWRHIN